MFFKSKKAVLKFSVSDQCLNFEGPVNADTVSQFVKQWQIHIKKTPVEVLSVDWSAVTESDSTGLALMLSIQAKQAAHLSLKNVPPKLLTLLHLYDLEEVFELPAAAQLSHGAVL
ncbi:STAS domain-containing protein [Thiosulfativibrio zosterae]|uniref:STAS domain-containing protein n=1 Tax=Thiosulfativibrio zosterae TaxID=2675053 RepID=A0A6F8PME5_9GAMM|nr:STAS domain-containing protein [Thiosulfativibrio zosterae]BBP43217.1 hypothetical protein THMIRHAT_09630 [Thiosulfativibrio zosterae]